MRVRALRPAADGSKATDQGRHEGTPGPASARRPHAFEFTADREGYHPIAVTITDAGQSPARAHVKVEYEAAAESDRY